MRTTFEVINGLFTSGSQEGATGNTASLMVSSKPSTLRLREWVVLTDSWSKVNNLLGSGY